MYKINNGLMKKFYLAGLAALLSFTACQTDEVVPVADPGPSKQESLIVTSSEEVDALLYHQLGTADMSVEEKLMFLSDYHAQQATEKQQLQGRGASVDTYVAIAQVYDGTNYYTDVATGNGYSNLTANELQLRGGYLAFGACSANVYRNNINIGGRATNKQNFQCDDDIFMSAIARWKVTSHPVHGTVSNSVKIFCDRLPSPRDPDLLIP